MNGMCGIMKQICEDYLASNKVPGILTATVKEVPPDTDEAVVAIDNSKMELPISEFIVADTIDTLKKNDKLIIIVAAGGQRFFILAKVKEVS